MIIFLLFMVEVVLLFLFFNIKVDLSGKGVNLMKGLSAEVHVVQKADQVQIRDLTGEIE